MADKTKIDWCDASWNPVTGCLHGCEYCYARRMAHRYAGGDNKWSYDTIIPDWHSTLHVLERPASSHGVSAPYPYDFDPCFHRYRLDIPQRWKKPRNIFVCSMADLFGAWVPDEWIQEVFRACEDAPHHRYLFLTKNPKRYDNIFGFLTPSEDFYIGEKPEPTMLFGTSATNNEQMVAAYESEAEWIPIEPIHECLEAEWFFDNRFYPDGEVEKPRWKWVVIGAETGNRKGRVIPKREWIIDIADACVEANVPIFMKESLRAMMGTDFRQEYPWRDAAT